MSERARELAERHAQLTATCAAQRAAVAYEVANIEARFAAIDEIVGLARRTLSHPAVLVATAVALFVFARLHGGRLVGRGLLLALAARRLVRAASRRP
jgi:hypothetical protein